MSHGHQEILAPLLKTSIGSYNAAGSEGLGPLGTGSEFS